MPWRRNVCSEKPKIVVHSAASMSSGRLAMPAETRHYVPKLIALKHIVMRPDAFGIALPEGVRLQLKNVAAVAVQPEMMSLRARPSTKMALLP